MQLTARWLLLAAGCLLLAHAEAAPKSDPDDIQHMREELGINEFTAPSIDVILQELDALKPIPFDKVWRDIPESTPTDRPRLALAAGAVIGDGFLAVASEKQGRIENVGRALLRLAKGLGVADRVNKHSHSILEKAAKQQWDDVKHELKRAQADVEAAMMALKDEEIAHLVALGGWLRGLEATSGMVMDDYSADRARRLIQPELLDYFLNRLSTVNPTLKRSKAIVLIQKDLTEVKAIVSKPAETPIEKDEVKRIRELAKEMNKAIFSDE